MNSKGKNDSIYSELNILLQKFDVSMPIIVLMGSQRSKKEAVLTALAARNILPKNTDLVIDCPLLFKLEKTDLSEYAYLNGDDSNRIEISTVNEELENLFSTANKYKPGEIITINLRMHSGLGVSILYVPDNFKLNDIHELILTPNNVLIAVSDTIHDISNSEAVKLIYKVDPTFKRSMVLISNIENIFNEGNDQENINEDDASLNIVGLTRNSNELELKRVKINSIKTINVHENTSDISTDCTANIHYDFTLSNISASLKEVILKLYFRNLKDCATTILSEVEKKLSNLHNEMSDLLNLPNLSFEQYEKMLKDGVASFLIQKDILLKSDYLMSINSFFTGIKGENLFNFKGKDFTNLLLDHFNPLDDFNEIYVSKYDILSDYNSLGIEECIRKMIKTLFDSILNKAFSLSKDFNKVLCEKINNVTSEKYPNLAKFFNLEIVKKLKEDAEQLKQILEITLSPIDNIASTSASRIVNINVNDLYKQISTSIDPSNEVCKFGQDHQRFLNKNMFQIVVRLYYNYYKKYFGQQKFKDLILNMDIQEAGENLKEKMMIKNNFQYYEQLVRASNLLKISD